MVYEFRLPDIGEGLTEGTISEWLVAVGDEVAEDAPLCVMETDKVAVEITAPCTGKIRALNGQPGEALAVGTVIAVFETDRLPAGATAAAPDTMASQPAPAAPAAPAAPTATATESTPLGKEVRATPATRKLARQRGIDLNRLAGSGPHGRILQGDVLAPASAARAAPVPHQFAATAIPAEPGQQRVAMTTLQRTVAEQMVRSVRSIPHASSSYRCEAGGFAALRPVLQERLGQRISFTAMVMKAMVPALGKYPNFNCSLDDTTGEIVYPPTINIGFATHTDDGLLVPVVRDCGAKSLAEIAAEVDRLAEAARTRKIAIADLRGGTITLSNIGSHGRIEATGGRLIINHPQAAIIGMSRIRPQAVVCDGEVVVRPCIDIHTSYDHRLIDGIYANLFIEQLADILEQPGLMLAA